MTGPDAPDQSRLIDGKYRVLRELARQENVTISEVSAAEGVTRHVAWFDVSTPADRQAFHAYRTVLRTLEPAGLTDVVARPGAFYAVWQPVTGTPLDDVLAQPVKSQETVEAVQALAARLAAHGYALTDADIVMNGHEPQIAYLRPATRTPEDIATLNAPALAALSGGRVKRRREPGAWLTFVPGLLFLGGAIYLGGQAAQIYLNPPVREVADVAGQEAQDAARKLTAQGFRVQYTEGQSGAREIGQIIRQEPQAGTNLPVGRLVTLTVNNPPSVAVPRVEEMTVDQVKSSLKDGALVLGKVLTVDGTLTNTAKGHVIAQLPQPGSQTQPGQPVQVLVSSGVQGKETWIPDLTGMTYEQAREYARAAGLVVNRVKEQPSDEPANTVLEQVPAPYVRVEVGSPVTLTVATARYAPPTQSAGNLQLPPPYVPPATAEPEAPVTPDPGQPPEETAPEPAPPAATGTVTFDYTFPADLPDGSYSVVVRDDDGQREVMAAMDAGTLRGNVARTDQPIPVNGEAVFVILRDGGDYATVTPLTP